MAESTRVFLDPDGTVSVLGVLVAAPTGVTYEHQCGGVRTDLRSLEGFYVPVGGGTADLTAPFHQGRKCLWVDRPILERLERLRAAVAQVPFWFGDTRQHLAIDESRLDGITEAWVPVITPMGPGVLVWDNCD